MRDEGTKTEVAGRGAAARHCRTVLDLISIGDVCPLFAENLTGLSGHALITKNVIISSRPPHDATNRVANPAY